MSSPASGATYLYKIGDVLLVVLRNGVAYRRGPGEVIVTARDPYIGEPYCDYKYQGSDKLFYNYKELNLDFQQDKNGDWRFFDEKGRVWRMGDRSKTLATILYDSGYNYPVGVEDGNGRRVIWYEYNDDNLISAVRDLAGRRVEYEYQGKMLVKVRDPLGNETMFHYAVINEKSRAGRYADFVKKYFVANDNVLMMGDTSLQCSGQGGWGSTSAYNEPLNEPLYGIVSVTYPNSERTGVGHYPNGDVKVMSDRQNRAYNFEYKYDKNKKEYYTMITGPHPDHVKEIWYDEDGMVKKMDVDGRRVKKVTRDETANRVSTTNADGDMVRKTYDSSGNVRRVSNEDKTDIFYEYNSYHQVTKTSNERQIPTEFEYDAQGNLTRVIEAVGMEEERITQYTHDADGNILSITRPGDANTETAVTTMTYDQVGNMATLTDPEGHTTGFTHDVMGNVLTRKDPRGNMWAYEYDALGRMTKSTDPLDNITRMEYDSRGNLIRRIDHRGNEKTFEYNVRGDMVKAVDALGNAARFDFDKYGNMYRQIDEEGKETWHMYDTTGKLVKITDGVKNEIEMEIRPMGQETTYAYDGSRNLTEKIDAKGQKTSYIYDAANRMISVQYYNTENHATPVKTVIFTYGKAGNLTGYDDGVTTGSYTYDALNRKVSEIVDYGDFTLSNAYTFYKNGLKETFTGPDGIVYQYTYDENNRLTGVQIPDVGYITYSDYVWNQPSTISLPGGSAREVTYDPLMRVDKIKVKDPGQNILMNYQYTYDKMGNILAKSTEHGNYTYEYDSLYRLTNANNPTLDDEAFTYDAVGNRLTS
ncbi:MAG: hypothetical protein GY866_19860, partial [Proteobacteria bacterium]|nr:hypothetical protein [Pseudomonadota bacterium]